MRLSIVPFSERQWILFSALRARGWSQDDFATLSQEEQNAILAYEYARNERRESAVRAILEQRDSDGRLSAESVTARALINLLLLAE